MGRVLTKFADDLRDRTSGAGIGHLRRGVGPRRCGPFEVLATIERHHLAGHGGQREDGDQAVGDAFGIGGVTERQFGGRALHAPLA